MRKKKLQASFFTMTAQVLKEEADLLMNALDRITELEARIEKLEEKSPAGDAAGRVVKAFLDRLMENENETD